MGFTLLEVLVVMGLIIMVAGFGLVVSFESYRGYNFRSERDTIVSVLQKARSQAINNMCFGAGCTNGKPHGVYFGTIGKYIIFQGTSYATRDTAVDETINAANASASISGIQSVVFSTLSGDAVTVPASPATLTVIDTGAHTSTITVDASGRIWWNN